MTEPTGPRLTDAQFFEKIDPAFPGMENIPALATQGDFSSARRLFAAAARRSLRPDRFLSIRRTFRGEHFMKPGETPAQAAERIVSGELISCSTPHQFPGAVDWFTNPTFNQYKEWTWQLSRHSEWGILAEMYRETGDPRYARSFVDYFTSWVRQALVPENAPGSDTLAWRTIEAGIRMGGTWHWALHTFYNAPEFTDDVLVDWYKSIWEHGWRLRNFHRTGNWLIMEMNGLAQVAVLYPMFRDAPGWRKYAFDRLIEELDLQVYPDGFQVELSTGYHQVDIVNYQWLIDVLKAYGEPVPAAFTRAMERMHAVNVDMMMPDGRLPDVNDGGWHDVAGLMEDAARDYPERADFTWAHTRGAAGAPPDRTSLLLPYAGFAVMRTGWQADAVWALFDGGHFGYGHQHEDKLSLLLHAYGRLLLTEGGNYAYDDSEMRRYVLSTRSHNTVRVDGQDQNRRRGYDREQFDVTVPSGVRWHTEAAYDCAESVYDEGYGPDADRSVTHTRKVIFLKQPPAGLGPCLLVIDRLAPADPDSAHAYEWLWHLDSTSAAAQGLRVVTGDDGLPNLAVIPAGREGLSAQVVCGQEQPEWQGWKSIKNHQQGEYAPISTAVYRASAAGPLRLVTLLYPTRPGEACPVLSVSQSPDPAQTAILLALSGGELALDEADYRLG